MRALLLALAACSYDPRGVSYHGDDIDAATAMRAPDAGLDVSPTPDATPPDATAPDATPPDAAPPDAAECGCGWFQVCCDDGSCALLGLC